jgi:hypothetical protein
MANAENPQSLLPQTTLYGIKVDSEATYNRFNEAIDIIDSYFGTDYSKKNPHLVAAVLQAMVAASKS